MFIAHIPAGYILTKKLQDNFKIKKYLWVGILASILPDVDIIYFYLIDNKQHLHHDYWIHIPFYWFVIIMLLFTVDFLFNQKKLNVVIIFVASNIFLHLILDTIVGKVNWLYPFSQKIFSLFEVPSIYNFWVWNFVFHWTFLLEIFLIGWAIKIFLFDRKN